MNTFFTLFSFFTSFARQSETRMLHQCNWHAIRWSQQQQKKAQRTTEDVNVNWKNMIRDNSSMTINNKIILFRDAERVIWFFTLDLGLITIKSVGQIIQAITVRISSLFGIACLHSRINRCQFLLFQHFFIDFFSQKKTRKRRRTDQITENIPYQIRRKKRQRFPVNYVNAFHPRCD